MVRQVAEVDKRVVYYAKEVEQELVHGVEDSSAPADWPSIVVKDITLGIIKS
jgi:hypothetical protein